MPRCGSSVCAVMGRRVAAPPSRNQLGGASRPPVTRCGGPVKPAAVLQPVEAANPLLRDRLAAVNGARKLTPCRHPNVDPLLGCGSLVFGGCAGGDAAE